MGHNTGPQKARIAKHINIVQDFANGNCKWTTLSYKKAKGFI